MGMGFVNRAERAARCLLTLILKAEKLPLAAKGAAVDATSPGAGGI